MTQEIATIRIELQGWRPKIWRKVDVALATDLGTLHEIIQAAMGWSNSHMHSFEIGDKTYGVPAPSLDNFITVLPAHKTTMKTLVKQGFKRFTYDYDFGDCWSHDIIIGKSREGNAGLDYPIFVAGEGRCPPEDIGGLWGFKDFLEVMKDPDHPEHDEMFEWYGDDFDPADMDELQIRARLGAIAADKPIRLPDRSGSQRKTS